VAEFDLKTLCVRAEVTPRTVHFYVQQGLLPPAGSPGPGARYGEGHVARLRLIRLLQKQHLPLAEIAKRMKGLTDVQVAGLIAEAKERRQADRGSALEYIRSVLGEARATPSTPMALSAPQPAPRMWAGRVGAAEPASTPQPGRSQWDRFTFADGIELHVRRPLTRMQQRRLGRLITAASGIFEEES
jgi:DNA-binding transcriptional MerR regulator